ncbi:MAG: hypothetical protein GY832_30990 [Chloroflexi bacterium]|nr:hypothetical protein [Chloroflexota bacterium]
MSIQTEWNKKMHNAEVKYRQMAQLEERRKLKRVNAHKVVDGVVQTPSGFEVPASFVETPADEEDDGETILRNGKVSLDALTHSGFGLMTRQGEVTIPLPSFGWWIRLNQFHRSQSAYQLSVQAVLQPDKAAELAPSIDYLRRISPLRWFPTDYSQVMYAQFYALVFPLRVLHIKLQIKEMRARIARWDSRPTKGRRLIRKLGALRQDARRRKMARLENLLAEVEDTENSLIDSPPDKGVVEWLETIIDPATVFAESEQAIDTINAYFGKKKRVNLPVL